jgi:hypothetical protein
MQFISREAEPVLIEGVIVRAGGIFLRKYFVVSPANLIAGKYF